MLLDELVVVQVGVCGEDAVDLSLLSGRQVFGRVENVLDEDYWEVITYPSAPRAAYVGLKARF